MEQQCHYSPTYLSTNLLTPLRTPIRETVPRTNIIAGGTSVAFKPNEWGSCATDYGGVGSIKNTGYKRNLKPVRELPYPRSHLHYISGLSKVLHNVVQPQDITALRKSNCRQNDQLLLQPHLMTDHGLSKEENHFVQEPSYSSHICRTSMFPQNRLEQQSAAKRPSELDKHMPLCESTITALSRVIRNRYKVTSYEKDYRTMSDQYGDNINQTTNKNFGCKNAGCKENTARFNTEEPFVRQQKSFSALCPFLNRNAKGLWPCWPVGSNYIVSNVTGQIIEKRDVRSLDDKRDYRQYKLSLLSTHTRSASENKKKETIEESKDNTELQNIPNVQEDFEKKISQENKQCEPNEQNVDYDGKDLDQSTEDIGISDDVGGSKEVLLGDQKSEIEKEITDSVKSASVSENDGNEEGNKNPVPGNDAIQIKSSRKTAKKWQRNFVVTAANDVACSGSELLPDEEVLEKISSKDFKDLKIDRKTLSVTSRLRNALPLAPEFHPIKLPPEPLYKSLYYAGDRVADRLGVRYKTVALKRYHLIHPESIPDLKDFRPPVRKCKFLGYHTSTFR